MLKLATMTPLSTLYVKVPVRADHDPTDDTVQLAFMTTGEPTDDDWVTGLWDDTDNPYKAMALVGPGAGGHDLGAGRYQVWINITDNPERPIEPAGYLIIE